MNRTTVALLTDRFASLKDPRTGRAKRHKFIDVLVIAICAVICGADSWVDVEMFGNSKKDWLSRLLELPNGIPSHDTFGRVFAMIDPVEFEGLLHRVGLGSHRGDRRTGHSHRRQDDPPFTRQAFRQVSGSHGERVGVRQQLGSRSD